jgi:hypothetical protein
MDIGNLGAYPHLFPPAGFTQFHRNKLLTIPAVAGTTELERILISSNQVGWLRMIGLEAGDWNIGYFSINMGGQPLLDYVQINVPLGNVATPVPLFVKIAPNNPLTLTYTSTGAAPNPLRWSLWGWFYADQGGF